MDENIISLLEELSLRTSVSEDEGYKAGSNGLCSNYTSCSNVSSPTNEQIVTGTSEDDIELKNAVHSLFRDLNPSTSSNQPNNTDSGYDKFKMLAALLGNIDLVTNAVRKINQSVAIGKKMEQIYRSYYIDPGVDLDLNEIGQLIRSFTELYESESYVREVNVSRVYHAFCRKLEDIYNLRMSSVPNGTSDDCMMI